MLINKNLGVVQKEALTFDQESSLTDVHANSYPHRGTKVGGGGWAGWNPSPEFLIYCSISKRFYL